MKKLSMLIVLSALMLLGCKEDDPAGDNMNPTYNGSVMFNGNTIASYEKAYFLPERDFNGDSTGRFSSIVFYNGSLNITETSALGEGDYFELTLTTDANTGANIVGTYSNYDYQPSSPANTADQSIFYAYGTYLINQYESNYFLYYNNDSINDPTLTISKSDNVYTFDFHCDFNHMLAQDTIETAGHLHFQYEGTLDQ